MLLYIIYGGMSDMVNLGSKLSIRKKEAILFYILVSPFILCFIFLKIFPMLYAFYLSFTNSTGFNWDTMRVVGLKNYSRILSDGDVLYSAYRTFLVAIIFVPLQLIVVNLTALLLTRKIKAVGVFRTIYYIPSIVPIVAGGMMWTKIYAKDGVFNQILGLFGININFLDYNWCTPSMIFMMLWGLGTGLLVTIAAIKNVPAELYEAAEIDGINSFKRFTKITLPIITPINLYNLLMGIIGALQIYAQPVMITTSAIGSQQSGILAVPLKPNYLYLVHIYQQIFSQQRFGYGMALIWVLFVVIVGLTLLVLKTSRRWVIYEVDQDGGNK